MKINQPIKYQYNEKDSIIYVAYNGTESCLVREEQRKRRSLDG